MISYHQIQSIKALDLTFTSEFGLTVRFATLRILLIALLEVIVIDIWRICSYGFIAMSWFSSAEDFRDPQLLGYVVRFFAVLLTALIAFLHNTASAFGGRFILPRYPDLVIVLGEAAVIGYRAIFPDEDLFYWNEAQLTLTKIGLWASFVAMIFLIFIRIVDCIRLGKQKLWNRYNFSACEVGSTSSNAGNLRHGFYILTGRSLWKSEFFGESGWIIGFRALCTILVVAGMGLYGLWNIILDPIQHEAFVVSGYTTPRELKVVGKQNQNYRQGGDGWRVYLTWTRLQFDDATAFDDFKNKTFRDEAVKIHTLAPLSASSDSCSFMEGESYYQVLNSSRYDGEDQEDNKAPSLSMILAYHCPRTQTTSLDDKEYDFYIHPDFLVAVNFSHLGIPIELAEAGPSNILHVRLGLVEDSSAFDNTRPTSLIPGVNLVGMSEIVVRQTHGHGLDVLFVDKFETSLIADIVHLWADPRPVPSSVMETGPDIATIRIRAQADTNKWRLLKDCRKTAWDGFSDVGGMWTFIAGLFAALFGSSLMGNVFGGKSLPLLGLAHYFQREKLREAFLKAYPGIQDDMQHGLLKMICDYHLDTEFLEAQAPAESAREVKVVDEEKLCTENEALLPHHSRSSSATVVEI